MCRRMHKLPSDRCWWCGQDERQTRHHHFVNCAAWRPQIQELWKQVGKRCGWKHPRAPRVALFFDDERATKAALSFLRKPRVGQAITIPPRDGGGEEEREENEVDGEEGGPGPPHTKWNKGGAEGGGRRQGKESGGGFGFLFLLLLSSCFWYTGTRGSPAMTAGTPLRRGFLYVGDGNKGGRFKERKNTAAAVAHSGRKQLDKI